MCDMETDLINDGMELQAKEEGLSESTQPKMRGEMETEHHKVLHKNDGISSNKLQPKESKK